ncbi:NO-inducible flavohemoprotein [Ramlibacter rhizophilus]|uniref:Flavohemoprotein n=1 Tax=Ramlibacter rhizophilus TaxID=1781167 RepID=A0A4Z0BNK6_9BURK|nr:NO-inducible flavohemoprotein [Ramlibacter rhizophilus]TFY99837.1 NO-inducible flavohemoprotein [Ramlibacter rhizophilus]
MLTDAQRAIVKATVPLLETGGEALTTHFYKIMLAEYPEVRPLFNQAHQASGDQPRALANSVLMYARHIDRLEALGGLPAQIVAKHVSLQVLPQHYPIVGACLLRAIREVLGAEVATDEVIAAWGAAYQQLADLLIAAEESAYAATEKAEGGWRGARAFRVARKVPESSESTSFYLRPVDGGPVVAHAPGQYIGLRMTLDGQEQRRNYSLSQKPDGRELRISVKREADGRVSRHLHDCIGEGDILDVFPPAGGFVLEPGDRPLVLISGGVGITPTLAMLQAALQTQRPVHFIHCARNRAVHAFRDTVEALSASHPQLRRFYCYDQAAPDDEVDAVGLLDAERLAAWLPAQRDVDAYFLGPKPFMALVKRSLRSLGVPEGQMRYEFFGPAAALN